MPSGSDTTARRTREADEGCARLLSRQAVEGAPRPATTAGRGELWDESREREQWAEHSAGDAAASSGAGGSRTGPVRAGGEARGTGRARGAAHRGVLGRRGPPVRLADRRHAPGHQHARVLDVVVRRRTGGRSDHLGRDVLGDDLPPQARGRVGRAAAPDAVQPAHRDHLHRGPDGHRGGAVRLHRAGAEQRPSDGRDAGPEGRRRRVPVELAVHLPGRHHPDGRPGHHDRHRRHDPAAGAAHEPVDPVHPAQQRRDPQLLGDGLPVQARRLPDARR